MQFVDLKKQYELIKSDVQAEINQVLDSGQYIMGSKVAELENVLANYTGAKHCVGVCDGTKALLIALMALDIKAGDEVIVPAFTFIATVSMVKLLGAKPVFADVDEKTYNLDPNKIEPLINNKTKAIIPVSLYGQCADFDAINAIAAKHNLAVIEDGAQSFGATYNGRQSGNLTTIATTSFFPSKPLGCYGDGGAIFTNDDELAQKIRWIRVHGQDKRYHHAVLGLNGRLDTLQAGVLLAKMRIFPQEVILRAQVAQRYNELFEGANCTTPFIAQGNTSVYAQYSLLVQDRAGLIKHLADNKIPTAVHYPIPLHQQPIFVEDYHGQDLSVSENLSQRVISLPMHPYLDEKTQDLIVDAVIKFV
ncbi:MAG: DegT/DnrJ/EryC1/StrS family aminotransferase [Burkholderiales bacterium]|nr:DegT/DnrJ/EryC1/StrS family aminotransferase [Burkholderiales bacterium]MBY0245753.1 DegT/DnrJ/EryC1/StrS family aminotransferase [Sphingobacteriaceae bacterium]